MTAPEDEATTKAEDRTATKTENRTAAEMEDPLGKEAESRVPAEAVNQTTVIVTVSDEACENLPAVKERLEEAGLAVEETLEFLGQIVGKWAPKELGPLLEIEGVTDVSESKEIQLAPPGSLIQ